MTVTKVVHLHKYFIQCYVALDLRGYGTQVVSEFNSKKKYEIGLHFPKL